MLDHLVGHHGELGGFALGNNFLHTILGLESGLSKLWEVPMNLIHLFILGLHTAHLLEQHLDSVFFFIVDKFILVLEDMELLIL